MTTRQTIEEWRRSTDEQARALRGEDADTAEPVFGWEHVVGMRRLIRQAEKELEQ